MPSDIDLVSSLIEKAAPLANLEEKIEMTKELREYLAVLYKIYERFDAQGLLDSDDSVALSLDSPELLSELKGSDFIQGADELGLGAESVSVFEASVPISELDPGAGREQSKLF